MLRTRVERTSRGHSIGQHVRGVHSAPAATAGAAVRGQHSGPRVGLRRHHGRRPTGRHTRAAAPARGDRGSRRAHIIICYYGPALGAGGAAALRNRVLALGWWVVAGTWEPAEARLTRRPEV